MYPPCVIGEFVSHTSVCFELINKGHVYHHDAETGVNPLLDFFLNISLESSLKYASDDIVINGMQLIFG
jgi:hypothetical protein